ncbi:MAG: SagB family peptide dehydrogenase [Acidobacteriota bacterium]
MGFDDVLQKPDSRSYLRTKRFSIELDDEIRFDVLDFISGTLSPKQFTRIHARSHLNDRAFALNEQSLALLQSIPPSWTEEASLAELIPRPGDPVFNDWEEMLDVGLVLCSHPSCKRHRENLTLARSVAANFWPPSALAFHRSIVSQEGAFGSSSGTYKEDVAKAHERADRFIEANGAPPRPSFTIKQALNTVSLPAGYEKGQLYDALTARKTTRLFKKNASCSINVLATILRYTFGSLGHYEVSPDHSIFHKTSPSGGGLHPIEAFPVVLDVKGLGVGIYHYSCCSHHLSLFKQYELTQLRQNLVKAGHGQDFLANTCFTVLLVARWKRNFWKYRNSPNTYNVINSDAGHLGQTFQLVATQLGMGSFYSAAVDHRSSAVLADFEGHSLGLIGFCGCGVPDPDSVDLPFIQKSS